MLDGHPATCSNLSNVSAASA